MFKAIFRLNKLTIKHSGKNKINFSFSINVKMIDMYIHKCTMYICIYNLIIFTEFAL